jgi:hypothetical protein
MRKVKATKKFGRKAKPNANGVTKFEIAKLELHKGDTLVVRTDFILSKVQVKFIAARVRAQVPKGIKVMVLSAGLQLAVLEDKRRAA